MKERYGIGKRSVEGMGAAESQNRKDYETEQCDTRKWMKGAIHTLPILGWTEELSNVLGIQSKSTISDNCADVVFLYQNHDDFSRDIENFYTEILNRLKFKGLINE